MNEKIKSLSDEQGDQEFIASETAKIQKEYTRNSHQIDSINRVVERGDSVINAKLHEFDRTSDSLNKVMKIANQQVSR